MAWQIYDQQIEMMLKCLNLFAPCACAATRTMHKQNPFSMDSRKNRFKMK
jgi:hypothetical protein